MRRPPFASVVQVWFKSGLVIATLMTVLLNWPRFAAIDEAALAEMLQMWILLLATVVILQAAWWLFGE